MRMRRRRSRRDLLWEEGLFKGNVQGRRWTQEEKEGGRREEEDAGVGSGKNRCDGC
jgi:hypothetical protein